MTSTVTVICRLRKAALCVAASASLWAGVAAAQTESLRTETVAAGLEHPWAVAFLPEGGFLYLLTDATRGRLLRVLPR